jgi:SNF5 / SMARCB1 / INI1
LEILNCFLNIFNIDKTIIINNYIAVKLEMQLFDPDRYVREMEATRQLKPLKPPNNKVPPVNLSKLAFDKKLVPIVLDVKFGDKFILRDRFDWDLMEPRLRPIDFATALCN